MPSLWLKPFADTCATRLLAGTLYSELANPFYSEIEMVPGDGAHESACRTVTIATFRLTSVCARLKR